MGNRRLIGEPLSGSRKQRDEQRNVVVSHRCNFLLPLENRLKCHRQLSASEPRKSEITEFSWGEQGKRMESPTGPSMRYSMLALAAIVQALSASSSVKPTQDETKRGDGDGSDGGREPRSDRKPPKVTSPNDASSAWTAKSTRDFACGEACRRRQSPCFCHQPM